MVFLSEGSKGFVEGSLRVHRNITGSKLKKKWCLIRKGALRVLLRVIVYLWILSF